MLLLEVDWLVLELYVSALTRLFFLLQGDLPEYSRALGITDVSDVFLVEECHPLVFILQLLRHLADVPQPLLVCMPAHGGALHNRLWAAELHRAWCSGRRHDASVTGASPPVAASGNGLARPE